MSKKRHAPRIPLTVKGGIRSQSPHRHLRVWWSRRWVDVLEAFRLGARLGRGRSYAASGQVTRLAITPGQASATVQGSAPAPYRSTLTLRHAAGPAKAAILRALRAQPMLLARLLVADLPRETEAIFLAAGCPLFPQKKDDLTSHCTCPDYANPCKHLAAVYYLIGETIEQNPALLLELRGIRHQDLFPPATAAAPAAVPPPPSDAAPPGAAAFYGSPCLPFADYGKAENDILAAPLIYRLGALPLWRGQERFTDTLEHLYDRAAARALPVWAGEPLDLRKDDEKIIVAGANLQLKRRKMRVDTSWL